MTRTNLATLCLTFLSFSLLFFSCNNPSTPIADDFSYPLRVGNKWEYSHTMVGINYKVLLNDSVFVPKDTQASLGSSTDFVSVDRVDSTSLPVVTFVIRDSSVASGETNSSVGHSWYRNSTDGLYKYAIDFAGGPQASPKVAAAAKVLYRFKGREFSSPREINEFIMNGFSSYSAKRLAAPVGMTVFDPSQLAYQYPYKSGALWDFITDSIRIANQYVDKESMSTPAGTFQCYKVKRLWDWNHDGIWDTGYEGNDWISPTYGLVKRQLIIRDIEKTTFSNNFIIVIAKFDLVEDYTLLSAVMQ
jgi:hypothetical protein